MTLCVECKPDLILVQELTKRNNGELVHCGGKTKIILDLSNKYNNSKGLIDDDPDSPKPFALKQFKVRNNLYSHRILVRYNENNSNLLIILRPRLEGWILRASKLSSINVADYNLPTDEKKLIAEINYKLDNFRTLVQDLSRCSSSVQKLSSLLLE